MTDIQKNLKANLELLRELGDISVEDMVKKTGLEDYEKIENGDVDPTLSQLVAISNALDISIDHMIVDAGANLFFKDANYGNIDRCQVRSQG